MYGRLLESVSYYSKKALSFLQDSAGDLPQWTSDVLSSVRTHIKDVTHFLRGQSNHGIRYGSDGYHGRAYMAWKNLREISNYADESLSYMQEGAGIFPAWVENKISICAEYMDSIGHWLENEMSEARRYGSPAIGAAGDEALYRGRSDGISGFHKNPYSPNDFRHRIYEQGFSEGHESSSLRLSNMEFMLYHRMVEPNRMTEPHRMLGHQTGRRFGVPGFVPGQTGWAGQAGVAQIPHPSRRYAGGEDIDPRGHWAAGVPASAGFRPQEPVVLQGRTYSGPLPDKPKFKLSRHGAQRTRGTARRSMKR